MQTSNVVELGARQRLPRHFDTSDDGVTVAGARAALKAEFLADLLRGNGERNVRTSAWAQQPVSTVDEVISQMVSECPAVLQGVRFVFAAAAGGQPCALLAKTLLSVVVEKYAAEHAEDAAMDAAAAKAGWL